MIKVKNVSAFSKSGLVLSSKFILYSFILNLGFETTSFQLQVEKKMYNSGVTREVLRFFLLSIKNINIWKCHLTPIVVTVSYFVV